MKNSPNPWCSLPYEIYEKHMGHENVKQLEMLQRIVRDQLALVEKLDKPVVAMLGITDGNGLTHVQPGAYEAVIGLEINREYLDICRKRYAYLPELALYQIDLMTEKDRAAVLLNGADLITANLLVKHIHLDNFIDIVGRLTKPIVSVTQQFNPDGQPVSRSGLEAEFDEIQRHGEACGEEALTAAMRGTGYALFGRAEYGLPNGKIFIRLDYRRRETQPESRKVEEH